VAGRPRRKPLSDAEIDKIGNFNPYLTLPWLLVLYSPLHAVMSGQYPRPLYAYVGLGLFALLYVGTILTSFMPRIQDGRIPVALALVMVPVTGALAGSLPSALLLYSLLAVACAVVVPDRGAPLVLLGVPALGAFTAYMRGQSSDALSTALSGMLAGAVVFVMIKLFSVVDQLKETRQALAKGAVADERLRFSRDLHDLLGHTMSVVALKAEAVRRLAPTDLDAAIAQAASIEEVSRKALAEIREAVSGYRETGLGEELDRARSLLGAAQIVATVHESGPPLPSQTENLLAWIVREGVTNVVRHSRATHCEITLDRGADPVLLSIRDNGTGCTAAGADAPGNGLRGLTERVNAVGGTLTADATGKGFQLQVTLPVRSAGGSGQGRGGKGNGAPITA
jgi:two-component system sensor histidine kinase DesK